MKRLSLVILFAALGCGGDPAGDSAISAREQAALEDDARAAARGDVSAQTAQVQSRYRQAQQEALKLMRDHAATRLGELESAKSALSPADRQGVPGQDLDREIAVTRAHQQRLSAGRGSAPPPRTIGDAGLIVR